MGCGECRACEWYCVLRSCRAMDERGMRGVAGVCEMCMCLARGSVG